MPHSLGNHLYVSFITNCVLAKVYLFLPLCETMSVLQLLPLRPTGLWSADITHILRELAKLMLHTLPAPEFVYQTASSEPALLYLEHCNSGEYKSQSC